MGAFVSRPRGPVTAESLWIAELAKIPRIDAEQERELVLSGQREKLVIAFLPLARSVAGKLAHYDSIEDLTQQANLGLMQAAASFELDRGFRFQTYARHWIKAHTHRYLSDKGRLIRLPVHLETAASAFRKGLAKSPEDLMKLGMTETTARALFFMLTARAVTTEADEETGTKGFTLIDSGPSPEQLVGDARECARNRVRVNLALGHLTSRERTIVEKRTMGSSGDEATLGELGEQLGLSRERIRQIEREAYGKLRRLLSAEYVAEAAPKPLAPRGRGRPPKVRSESEVR